MDMKSLGIILGSLNAATAIVLSNYSPLLAASNCTNITFTVRASATNLIVDPQPNSALDSVAKVDAYLKAVPETIANGRSGRRTGKFKLAAVYCAPVVLGNDYDLASDTSQLAAAVAADKFPFNASLPLQVLVHGSTYTKEYWDLGAWGDTNTSYSWRAAANAAGYATLAVDKLGNGGSSHPDPILDVQLPLQVETTHAMITQIKRARAKVARPKPITLVGHSSGSILIAALVQSYPRDADAVVLTAYSTRQPSDSPNATLVPNVGPAAISDPRRFGNLSYGYLLGNSLDVRTLYGYYDGHYNTTIALNDYATRGVQPIGEGFSQGLTDHAKFKGKVLVVTGSKDQVICGATPAEQCQPELVTSAVVEVNSTFSSISGFEYYTPLAGHVLNWHYNAPSILDVSLQKLDYLLGREAEASRWTLARDEEKGQEREIER